MNSPHNKTQYDYVIIGSGFGGSVSALRLSQKGYKVLVIEKGEWYTDSKIAKSTWNLKRWLWAPAIGLRGIMKITPLKHVTIFSGVGVGGGSLTYAATLPTPEAPFFESGSWAKLQDWQKVLKPHYQEALRMLGAAMNPKLTEADLVLQQIAEDTGKQDKFFAARAGIFFSDKNPGQFRADPYFNGEGPDRKPCIQCGSCLSGCPHNAKNTLDKNYLYLAQKLGADILAEHIVEDVRPAGSADGNQGYFVNFKSSRLFKRGSRQVIRAKNIIFSGGVTGTVPLLLKLKDKQSLPNLSPRLGEHIRTNNETVTAVTSFRDDVNFSQGIGIGSVLHTDEHSHLEPIVYNKDCNSMKFAQAPRVYGNNIGARTLSFLSTMLRNPVSNLKLLFHKSWSKNTIYLLFMQHLDSTLTFKRGLMGNWNSSLGNGPAPSCHIDASEDLIKRVETIIGGKATSSTTEALMGTPTTAHVLGGAVMGAKTSEGVINDKCEVFGYKNLYVCDGSAISSNPGVNPSLSITAITEWAMSHIPEKNHKN